MMEQIPDWLLQIIIASSGATISGIILLLTHHSRVKQEIEIHRRKEIFERKQVLYRNLINEMLSFLDLTKNSQHDRGNWRIGQYLYTELMLIGGKSVIHAFNEHLKSKLAGKDDDVQHTNKIKDIFISIRKDLYDEELNRDEINFIQPTDDTNKALEIIEQNYSSLRDYGLTTFQKISKMDVEQISQKTKISIEILQFLKETAIKEIEIKEEFDNFINNLIFDDIKRKKESL